MTMNSGYLRRRGNKFWAKTISDEVDVKGENLTKVLDDMESLIKEKSNAIVFDDLQSMEEELSNPDNIGKYNVGTSVYIKDSKVSDKWIAAKLTTPDPTTGMYYELEDMESETMSIELVNLLRAGDTQVVFESDYLLNDVNLDVYTTVEGLDYISMDTSEVGKVKVNYPAKSYDVFVKLVIH